MDGRLAALTAACLGLMLAWLRGRAQQRRRRHAAGGRHPAARLVPRSRPLESCPGQLSLVSYNCLCQKYANPRRLPHVFAQFLDPDYRWERLRAELAAFGSDVIALQEVTVDRWLVLKAYMASLGYAAAAQAKAAAGGSDFMLAIFYRQDRLRLVWQEERSRVLLAALQCTEEGRAQGQVVWLANVHLEASPYRPNDRVSQLRSALQRLEAQFSSRAEAEAADVVICGDFNSLEQDSPCWLLRQGRLERNHTDAICPQVPTTKETIAHPFALHDAYEASGHRPPFTRKTGRQHAVLDFIWCSRHMRVVAVLRPLQRELRQQVERCFLPSRWHPSDHLPIGTVLQLSSGAKVVAAAPAGAAAVAAAADAAAAAAAAMREPT